MKIKLLTIIFVLTSFVGYSQNNFLTDFTSIDENVKLEKSRGYLFKQFEFKIPDDGTIAIASDDEYFYIGRQNSALITKLDLQGNQIGNSFSISGINSYTTLTYDGRYFWGSRQSKTINKIDMQANPPVRVGTVNSPVNVVFCTYDPTADDGNGGLWVGDFQSDLVLISLSGTELRRISSTTHGLKSTSGIALDFSNPDNPYFWTITSDNQPPVMKQINYITGEQTGEMFNLYDEGFTSSSDSGGGMLVMTDIAQETTTLVVLIQNSKVLGFDLGVIPGESIDIGVKSLDIQSILPNTSSYSISGKVKNYGKVPVMSFDINYQIDNEAIQTYSVTEVNLIAGSLYSFTHPTMVEPVPGSHKISVWTSKPNEEEDMLPLNDKIEMSNIVYNVASVKPRTILLEGFTSSTCGPCVQGNTHLKNVLNQNDGLYALIKYQTNWPGNGDPYYTNETGKRCAFYEVNSVPHIHVDGSAYNNGTTLLNNTILENIQSIPAIMDLKVDYYVENQTVYAKATVNSTIDISGTNLRLYMAIVEKKTIKNYGTNGEKEFLQVMKKFMPSADGINLGVLTANIPVNFEQIWEFKGNYRCPVNSYSPINHDIEHSVEDFNNLTIVAWIQNPENKYVIQACNGTSTNSAINVETTFKIYPNPFTDSFTLSNAENIRTVIIFNTIGQKIKEIETTEKSVIYVDIKGFATGIYLVEIEKITGEKEMHKVVKK